MKQGQATHNASKDAASGPWSVVFGAGIAQAVSAQPLVLTTFSLFIAPLTLDTGWSRSAIMAAFTACAGGMAVGMPIVGYLLGRFTARFIILIAWLGYCLSVASISLIPLQQPLFYLPFLLIGLCGSGTLIPFTKVVVSWFDERRGTAIGLAAALMGLGTTFTPLAAGYLITTVGYRHAHIWLALFALVVGLAMILPFVRGRGEHGIRHHGAQPAMETTARPALIPGLTLGQSIRTRQFWMILVALCFTGLGVVGFQANLVPIMASHGIILQHATIALSVFGFASLLGRFAGTFLDYIHATIVGATVLFMAMAGILILQLNLGFVAAVFGSALIGFAFGMEIDLLAYLTSRYFGMRHFGLILGVLQGSVLLCIATGPLIIGIIFDRTQSYATVLNTLAVMFAICGALLLILGPYVFPAIRHGKTAGT